MHITHIKHIALNIYELYANFNFPMKFDINVD